MAKGKFNISSWWATRKAVRDQLMHKPSMYSPEMWVDKWTPFFWTKNYIEQTLARGMAWDDVNKQWLLTRCDPDGRLLVRQYDLTRESMDVSLFSDVVVGSKGLVTHVGIDVSGYSKKELTVSTTGNCSVYVQFSSDDVNWFSWYDVQDVSMVWACNSDKKAWEIIDHTHYIRVLIYNSSASSVTVSASLMCQV